MKNQPRKYFSKPSKYIVWTWATIYEIWTTWMNLRIQRCDTICTCTSIDHDIIRYVRVLDRSTLRSINSCIVCDIHGAVGWPLHMLIAPGAPWCVWVTFIGSKCHWRWCSTLKLHDLWMACNVLSCQRAELPMIFLGNVVSLDHWYSRMTVEAEERVFKVIAIMCGNNIAIIQPRFRYQYQTTQHQLRG